MPTTAHPVARGAAQLPLLIVTSAFVGGMVGTERSVLPLLGAEEFGVASRAAATSFIATFGVAKALVNLVAGRLSERWGRRRVLLAGWLVGTPVPFLILLAPSWGWIVAANVLLGVNQALTWSMTVVMKLDQAPARRQGLVVGWNEFAGYAGMASASALAGFLAARHGLRMGPFMVGVGLLAGGLVLSWLTRETRAPRMVTNAAPAGSLRRAAWAGSLGNPALSAASLSGLVTNFKDGALWGLLALLLAERGVPLEAAGVVVAAYPAVWAGSQLGFGAIADRLGVKPLIVAGLIVQSVGIGAFALGSSYAASLGAAVITGLGTGMVYPTLQVHVSQVAGAEHRATALGVYRFWRDLGYALGALGAGVVADRAGIPVALGTVALVMGATAAVMQARMRGRDPQHAAPGGR
jgi:MFS family permease